MKTARLLATVLMTAGALVSFSSIASAGEGGAAGSVSVMINADTAEITNLSAAAAVGKHAAAAATQSSGTDTFASAFGSAGALKVTDAGSSEVGYESTAEAVGPLAIAQGNELTGKLANINAVDGTVYVLEVPVP
jgi:hypothetical protein